MANLNDYYAAAAAAAAAAAYNPFAGGAPTQPGLPGVAPDPAAMAAMFSSFAANVNK
jgi:hypothetical protein